jgi:hypothetical protein
LEEHKEVMKLREKIEALSTRFSHKDEQGGNP